MKAQSGLGAVESVGKRTRNGAGLEPGAAGLAHGSGSGTPGRGIDFGNLDEIPGNLHSVAERLCRKAGAPGRTSGDTHVVIISYTGATIPPRTSSITSTRVIGRDRE